MKKLKMIIVFFFLIPQFTFASNSQALKSLVDNYVYDVNVEWDQVNQDFVSEKDQELREDLSVLIKNGLTEEDISEVFPSFNAEIIKNKFNERKITSSSDIAHFIIENRENFYAKGASWNGDTIIGIAVATVFVTGLVLLFSYTLKKACDEGRKENSEFKCDT